MNTTGNLFRLILAVSAGLPFIATAGCESPSRSAEPAGSIASRRAAAPARATPPIAVTLAPVQHVSATRPVRAMGRVAHDRDVKLGFKTGGLVAEVLVHEGERVVAGQVVARLDTREIDAGIAQAAAGLAKARRDLGRAQGLVDEAVIPGAQRDDAQTATRVAAAALAGARFNRETTVLIAPSAGVVVKRLSEPGEVMAPGAPVLVLGLDADDGRTLVEVGVPARDVALLQVGDAAEVRLDGARTGEPAHIVEIAPTLVAGTDQIKVTVALERSLTQPTTTPARGLVASVTIALTRAGSLPSVPVSAITDGEGRNAAVFVLATDGHHVERRPIVVESVRSDGQVLVRDGLDGVDAVIDAGAAWLDAAATVTVTSTVAHGQETSR